MSAFIHQALPMRIVFGVGALSRLSEELERLHIHAPLLVCTPGQRKLAEQLQQALGRQRVGLFDDVRMHVPVDLVEQACSAALRLGADACITLGGGSAIGLGKAIALNTGIPIVAIPTTFSGSEVTPIFGITDQQGKQTGRDTKVMPKTVIYDPTLLAGLPARLAASSGLNALAHAAEALYASSASPITLLMAEESARSLAAGLPRMLQTPRDLSAVAETLQGAWLAGVCLGSVGMALHHQLCHILGGSFNLPHAETHAIMLPHVLAYNRHAAPNAITRLGRALQHDDPPLGVYELAQRLGAAQGLADLGLHRDNLELVLQQAMKKPYPNPRTLEASSLQQLLRNAYHGTAPSSL